MNRYLISSVVIGASFGMLHGRMYRGSSQPWYMQTATCVQDGVSGALLYPFVIPIATYQLYTTAKNASSTNCVFTELTKSKSKTLAETPATQ